SGEFIEKYVGDLCFQVPKENVVDLDDHYFPPEWPAGNGFAFEISSAKIGSLGGKFVAQTDINDREIPVVGSIHKGKWSARPAASDDPRLAEALSNTAIIERDDQQKLLFIY